MSTFVLTVDDDVSLTDKTDRIQQAIEEAEDLDDEALHIAAVSQESNWEPGEPCPECGNARLSAMGVEEDTVISKDGDCEFAGKGDAIGGYLDFLCPECMTRLRDVPYPELQA